MGIIERILSHERNVDWKQLAHDCNILADGWEVCFRDMEGPVIPPADYPIDWRTYWYFVRGRFEERLNPSDLREVLEQREDDQAELRLKTYFFEPAVWTSLPDRCRRSLVTAERTWFFTTGGRFESLLSDLKITVETLCFELFWQRLLERPVDSNPRKFAQRFIGKHRELQKPDHYPSVSHYAEAFSQREFKRFLAGLGITDDEREFVTRELPLALWTLGSLRNPADHKPDCEPRKEDVQNAMRQFLGIHQGGVLPRLAAILSPPETERPRKPRRREIKR